MENAAQTTEREGYTVGNKAQKIFHFYQRSCKLECKLPQKKKLKHVRSQLYSNAETDPFQLGLPSFLSMFYSV